MASLIKIKKRIISEIKLITDSHFFKEWLDEEYLGGEKRKMVVINNSFIFRDNIKTVKNKKFICFDISDEKVFNHNKLFVVDGINFNSPFKILHTNTSSNIIKIDEAIKTELKLLGDVLYSVVGKIEDINDITYEFGNSNFKNISLIPTLSSNFEIDKDHIKIKDCNDREDNWLKIEKFCDENDIEISDQLKVAFDKALTYFQDNAFSTLTLPKKFDSSEKYLLDQIALVIDEHLTSYHENILKLDSHPQVMTEVLRISYNFVSDVNKLLTLLINIYDLKPLILWLSISKYLSLDHKFKELPFGFSRKKASLADYESIIKNARNKSFHQLFPFNKSLRFKLDKLDDINVTIFSTHGKKDGNRMTFKDQPLYELLTSFTRVNEQVVSKDFWVKNEAIIKCVHELIISTSESIKLTR